MEYISKNNKKYNYKLDKNKYNTNQEENENEIELINDMNNIYLIKKDKKEIYNTENIKYLNIPKQDNSSQIINDNNSLDYIKNNKKKKIHTNNSFNPFFFDNNIDDNNYENNIYNAQIIKSKKNYNSIITGSKGKYSNTIKYNNSLSKKDQKKVSNMAKTLKLFSNKGVSNISYNYDINSGKRNDSKKNLMKDFSNDNKYDKNIIKRNFDIQINSSKNKGSPIDRSGKILDIANNKLLLNINKDMLSTKFDLKNKIINGEIKSKTPLKVDSRYNNKNNDQKYMSSNNNYVTGDNNVDRKENEINDFLDKDEWNLNIESEEINNDIEDDKDIISYKMDIRDFSERNNDIIRFSNTGNMIQFDDNNLDGNIKVNKGKNKIPNYTATNFSNKKNKYEQNYINLIKDYQKSNLNDKSMKTPKSIKDNTAMDIIFSKSGKNYKFKNNSGSFKNSFNNDPLLKKVNSITINNSNLNAKTSLNNINNDNITPTVNINIQQKINNINNMNQPQIHIFNKRINPDNNKIIQASPQIDITNNNIRFNGIERNTINKKNVLIKQNSKNKIVFQKKNRSPPTFKKKIKEIIRINRKNTYLISE
jgi:hypothetical protein